MCTIYVCIWNEKPKVNLKDNTFKSNLFNSKTTERQKWYIVNDTRKPQKSANNITLLKISFGEGLANNFKMANFLNYKFCTRMFFLSQKIVKT